VPQIQTYIGRTDATAAAPPNQLPAANVSAADALSHFQAAGFSAQDLAALIGAHTASRQFNTDVSQAGAAQDITPGVWVREIFHPNSSIFKNHLLTRLLFRISCITSN
jgi:hypothetical protein